MEKDARSWIVMRWVGLAAAAITGGGGYKTISGCISSDSQLRPLDAIMCVFVVPGGWILLMIGSLIFAYVFSHWNGDAKVRILVKLAHLHEDHSVE